jgi:hypothetical protein
MHVPTLLLVGIKWNQASMHACGFWQRISCTADSRDTPKGKVWRSMIGYFYAGFEGGKAWCKRKSWCCQWQQSDWFVAILSPVSLVIVTSLEVYSRSLSFSSGFGAHWAMTSVTRERISSIAFFVGGNACIFWAVILPLPSDVEGCDCKGNSKSMS